MRNHGESSEKTPGQDGGLSPDQDPVNNHCQVSNERQDESSAMTGSGGQGDNGDNISMFIDLMVWSPLYCYYREGQSVRSGVTKGETHSKDGTAAVPGRGKMEDGTPRTPCNQSQKPDLKLSEFLSDTPKYLYSQSLIRERLSIEGFGLVCADCALPGNQNSEFCRRHCRNNTRMIRRLAGSSLDCPGDDLKLPSQ